MGLTLKQPLASKAVEALDSVIYNLKMQLASNGEAISDVTFFESEKYITVPHTDYTYIGFGLTTRLIDKNDTLFSCEEKYKDIILNVDFNAYNLIGVKFTKNEGIPSHFHEVDEIIHILDGSVEIDNNGSVLRKGSKLVIPAVQVHKFKPLEDGFGLILLKKFGI